jgi:enterochelin esterase family protein
LANKLSSFKAVFSSACPIILGLALSSCLPPPPTYSRSAIKQSGDTKPEVKPPEVDPPEPPEPEPVIMIEEDEPKVDKPVTPEPVVTKPEPTPTPTPTPSPVVPPVVVVPPAPVIRSAGDGVFNVKYTSPPPGYVGLDSKKLPTFQVWAKDSKIFPLSGLREQKQARDVRVFLPPGLDKNKEYPFMIILDDWYRDPMYSVFAKLIAEKKIPMMIAVFVDNGGGDSRGSQRGFEYDQVHDLNARYLIEEILPAVSRQHGVKFTKDPEGGGIFGASSSGAAAFTAAWFMPSRFRKVLGYSSTFTRQGGTEDSAGNPLTDGAWAYWKKLIPEAPLKPIRISLEVSTKDFEFFNSTTEANKKTYDALKAKGYHVRLQLAEGASHTDAVVMMNTIGENMIWLWRDYPR